MTLERVLEPEVMESADEALDYDTMDHTEVNRRFVEDLVSAGFTSGDVLDMGAGTAQIPILLCQRVDDVRLLAVDLSASMLDVARNNVEIAGLSDRIRLDRVDAKQLSMGEGWFDAVISNSIVHHLPEPLPALAEAVRVARPGGLLFFRDLLRPEDEAQLERLVGTYAGGETEHGQQMFADSLHAALNLAEIRQLVASLGFESSSVQATSDRHWTWAAHKAARPF